MIYCSGIVLVVPKTSTNQGVKGLLHESAFITAVEVEVEALKNRTSLSRHFHQLRPLLSSEAWAFGLGADILRSRGVALLMSCPLPCMSTGVAAGAVQHVEFK